MKALRSSLIALAVASLSPFIAPSPALAQEDPTIEAARERFKEGVTYFDNKEFERARLAFVQAYALKPHPALLLNLAQSELRSGHEAEAATHFARYLREHAEATEEQRQAAREGLDAAKQVVGVVALTVEPSGAEILVDGVSSGRSPLADPLYLTPGEHTIVAQKGGETARTTVTVVAGSSTSETLNVSAKPAPAAAASAPAPQDDDQEPEAAESYEVDSEDVASGTSWEVSTPVAIVGAGLSVAALGTGVVFAISARNYYDSADQIAEDIEAEAEELNLESRGICNPAPGSYPSTPESKFPAACKKYQDRVDTADKYKTYATIGFIAGGALAAGTLVYVLVPTLQGGSASLPAERADRGFKARLIPIVGPEHQGLVLQGSF
ncbi:MAG TPA: PEGA domain-containing protein [Polyangiaceae bacterium]|nr:PEGA domain-containing protein [Polyangiaceae bacterium]